ncbi:MAG: VCBS domain-containing protein [Sulfurovum sp.]|nr:VCBS domain-containing protein [Sulfurovum sp.]
MKVKYTKQNAVLSIVTNLLLTEPNTPATFSGDLSGSVINGRSAQITGTVNVSDPDIGEALIIPEEIIGDYGTLLIDANGEWTLTETSGLQNGETATEEFIITTKGGDTAVITITFIGKTPPP